MIRFRTFFIAMMMAAHAAGQGVQPAGPPHSVGIDEQLPPPGLRPSRTVTFRAGPGDSIGFTYYDFGSNGSSMRNLINYGNGTLVFARMSAVDPATDTRGSYYRFFDGSTWSPGWERIEQERRGWTNLAGFDDVPGMEAVLSHFPLEVNVHDQPGGAWTSHMLECYEDEWPRFATGSGLTLHAIATTTPPAQLEYHRSDDGGASWTCELHSLTASGVVPDADAYDITAQGDNVASVVAGAGGDVVLFESADGGDTWDEQVIYDIDESLHTPGEDPPDGSCSVLYDSFGNLHAAWGNYYSDGSGVLLLSPVAGIRHWSALTGVQEVAFADSNPAIVHHQATDGNYISQPMLASDEAGTVFIVYSRFIGEQDVNGNFYQHVFAVGSHDGGASWEAEVDLTPGEGFDASFPSVAALVDDSLHFVYMSDPLAGNWLRGTHPQIEVAHMHRGVHKEEILGLFFPPTLLSPLNGAVAQPIDLRFSWEPIQGVDRYHLQLSTENNFVNQIIDDSTVTATAYDVTDLDSSTVYFWRVRAHYPDHTSRWTATWTFRTVDRSPSVPQLVSPPDGSSDQATTVALLWDTSTYAIDYRVQVASDSLFTSPLIDDSLFTATSLLVEGLLTNSRYFWRVNARNLSFTSPWSEVWDYTKGGTVIPVTPSLYAPDDGATNQPSTIKVLWYPSVGADHYHLQVSDDEGFSSPVVDDSTLLGTWHIVDGLDLAQYYWRVRGLNENGSSPWSAVWRFTVGLITDVETESPLPDSYALEQNYPNPFNGISNFRFQLPKSIYVTLIVYDLLGREIARLIDGVLAPGRYQHPWNAAGLPSGVYLYRLQAGNFVQNRKLILLR